MNVPKVGQFLVFLSSISKENVFVLFSSLAYQCLECETTDENSLCAEPYRNKTFTHYETIHHEPVEGIDNIDCVKGLCVKWSRKLKDGSIYVRRTCSNNLTVKLPIVSKLLRNLLLEKLLRITFNFRRWCVFLNRDQLRVRYVFAKATIATKAIRRLWEEVKTG